MNYRRAALLLLVLFAAKTAWHLGDASLWTDEGWDISLASRSWTDMWRVFDQGSAHPPLFAILFWAWVHLVGTDSVTVLRLVSWAASVGTVAAILILGPRLVGPVPSLMGAALTAFSAEFMLLTQEIRLYPLSMFFYTTGALLMARALNTAKRRDVWWMNAFIALSLGTDVWGVDLIAALWSVLLWRRKDLTARGFPWRTFLVGHVCLLAAPTLAMAYLKSRAHTVAPYNHPVGTWGYFLVLVEFAAGLTHPQNLPMLPVALLLAVPVLIGCFSLEGPVEIRASLLGAEIWPWITAAAIFAVTGLDIVNPRRLAVALPLFNLLAGAGIVAIWRRSRLVAVTLPVALLLVNLQSTWNWLHDPSFQRQDWRDACAWLKPRISDRDLVVLQNAYCIYVFRYYMGPMFDITLPGRDPSALASQVTHYPHVWYVSCEAYQEDPDLAVPHWLNDTLVCDGQQAWPNTPQPASSIIILSFHH